ncbi:hypothetical protein WDU94_015049 [Cyamophila willieti]
MSNEQFIELLLSTKKPVIFAESLVRCDGTDWNYTEIQLLGDVNITMPVEIYDNGVWGEFHDSFRTHDPPLQGELLFTPGPLLRSRAMRGIPPPDLEEILTNDTIDQDKYNKLMDRRLSPLLYHANETAKKDNVLALITIPGVGCGAFSGKYGGQMGEHLNKALQHIVEKNAINLTHISCIYYDPYNECTNQDRDFKSVKYRVRPSKYNPNKSQLMDPKDYQELGDDFSKCKLFKIVAWDHVSFPGNDFYSGVRNTDDGVAAAATNSMEVLTGIKGKYHKGYYLPPHRKTDWELVVHENKIKLRTKDNVKILTSDGSYIDLLEFEEKYLKNE